MTDVSYRTVIRVEIDAWVKRLVKLGGIKDYENRTGGWFIFDCPHVDAWIETLLSKFDSFKVTESPKEVNTMTPDQAWKAGQMNILLQIKQAADKLSD